MRNSDFKPAWWLRNSHLQTIWPVITRKYKSQLPLERERVELPDGDFVDIDWVDKHKTNSPIVIILHGFEGNVRSHYAQGILQTLRSRKWRGAFMHFRGCSGEPNRLPRGYHSGETKDLENIVNVLIEREPNVPLAAVGYSLGGNVLLKWLGETGKNNPLKAAIAISVPFELEKAAHHVQRGLPRFYQWYFLRCLRQRLLMKFSQKQDGPIDIERLAKIKTIWELDNIYTAPLHGFNDALEYYKISSSRQYLRFIHTPTLLLHAKDDPLMTDEVIPTSQELSEKVTLELTEKGGHVGFVSGKYPWRPEYWLEKRIPEFLACHI